MTCKTPVQFGDINFFRLFFECGGATQRIVSCTPVHGAPVHGCGDRTVHGQQLTKRCTAVNDPSC